MNNAEKNDELLIRNYNPDIKKRVGDSDEESSDDLDSSIDEDKPKQFDLFAMVAGKLQMDYDPNAKTKAQLEQEEKQRLIEEDQKKLNETMLNLRKRAKDSHLEADHDHVVGDMEHAENLQHRVINDKNVSKGPKQEAKADIN